MLPSISGVLIAIPRTIKLFIANLFVFFIDIFFVNIFILSNKSITIFITDKEAVCGIQKTVIITFFSDATPCLVSDRQVYFLFCRSICDVFVLAFCLLIGDDLIFHLFL